LNLLVVCGIAVSKSEARRLIQQGGVLINDHKIEAVDFSVTIEQLKKGIKFRKGKKTYHKAFTK
jgi:Tyrosyl-tRNA synthetase